MDTFPEHPTSTNLDGSSDATASAGLGASAAHVDGTFQPDPSQPDASGPHASGPHAPADGRTRALATALLELQRWSSRHDSLGSAVVSPELSLNDLWLLQHVVNAGRARLSELAQWQRVDKSTVSSQVKSLISRGLVERHTDPADRRASLIAATAQGMTFAAAAIERAVPIVAAHQRRLTAAETEQLTHLLRAFLAEDA